MVLSVTLRYARSADNLAGGGFLYSFGYRHM
jgi:hypothetical protein